MSTTPTSVTGAAAVAVLIIDREESETVVASEANESAAISADSSDASPLEDHTAETAKEPLAFDPSSVITQVTELDASTLPHHYPHKLRKASTIPSSASSHAAAPSISRDEKAARIEDHYPAKPENGLTAILRQLCCCLSNHDRNEIALPFASDAKTGMIASTGGFVPATMSVHDVKRKESRVVIKKESNVSISKESVLEEGAPPPNKDDETPIPSSDDGEAEVLLPPILPHHLGKKCLVLDLDETLVHSSFEFVPNADFVIPIDIEGQFHNVYVLKRPFVDSFLENMGPEFEVAVFTASMSNYANPVLDLLDKKGVITHRLFREHCVFYNGSYVKDLTMLGRPIESCIIIDNNPVAYAFQPENAIPCQTWHDDPEDDELKELQPFLMQLNTIRDVRTVLGVSSSNGEEE
ncbi:hypothetical protein HDU98_001003 [Podochytrium sp. JEL0797]|nr:hypothetical protein HDU98_001003 [Podochytrium sp. JEL0797]